MKVSLNIFLDSPFPLVEITISLSCHSVICLHSRNVEQQTLQGHILKAGLDPGPWTLDPGLWTLDSGFFSSQNFIPPPQIKTSISPPKNLYISPMKPPPPPINISSLKYSVRVFKQTTLFPPPTSPKKPLCLPLKTAPSQKTPLPSPK